MGSQAQLSSENTWQTSVLGIYTTQINNFFDDITASGPYAGGSLEQVIPRYTYTFHDDATHHKYRKERTGLLTVDIVLTHELVAIVGSQRKRLRP